MTLWGQGLKGVVLDFDVIPKLTMCLLSVETVSTGPLRLLGWRKSMVSASLPIATTLHQIHDDDRLSV